MQFSKEELKRLRAERYFRTALEYTPENGPRLWPDDPPAIKNRLVLVPFDQNNAEEVFSTSTRNITIGREVTGGEIGERYGIAVGGNDRVELRAKYVLGGGQTQPDVKGGGNDRLLLDENGRPLHPGEDCELVRGCAVSENHEELKIPFTEDFDHKYGRDHSLWGNRYFLFGVRRITESIKEPDPSDPTQMIEVGQRVKKLVGLDCVDVYFLTITHVRLNYFGGERGETRERYVKSASELLRPLSREERDKKILPSLCAAHRFALAASIVIANELFGERAPEPLRAIVTESLSLAESVYDRSPYRQYFTKCVQTGDWIV